MTCRQQNSRRRSTLRNGPTRPWSESNSPSLHQTQCDSRHFYTVVLPQSGWFVVIEHARSITYLGAHIPLSLWERGIDEITVAGARSADRHPTTELAGVLAAAPLVGDVQALGIHCYSKYGTQWSRWAVWLRQCPGRGPGPSRRAAGRQRHAVDGAGHLQPHHQVAPAPRSGGSLMTRSDARLAYRRGCARPAGGVTCGRRDTPARARPAACQIRERRYHLTFLITA